MMAGRGWAKDALRSLLRGVGVEVYKARGGLFLCRVPHASRPDQRALRDARRLNLGCGNVRLDGYANIDIVRTPATDIVANIVSLPMIADNSIEVVRLEAVYEHLHRFERKAGLREWRRVLQPMGELSIAWIPDFEVYAELFLNQRAGALSDPMTLDELYGYTHGNPMPGNAPEQIHKDVFTKDSVRRELEDAGFEVVQMRNACHGDERVPLNINLLARKT